MHCWASNFFTDEGLDTAVAVPREIARNVRQKVMSKRYTFVVLFGTTWGSVHLPWPQQ